ncbi:hypothetical protein [Paenibacillus hemerocallicola]|uniref:hypothetical protein n=1 Tax=Paenibacillus hemerocallicola TaxID=1172614 RepID=UPI00319E6D8E
MNGFSGKLGWLEYSLKRSLRIECTNEEEQQMGTEQVTGTINAIRRYANNISELEKWLKDEMLERAPHSVALRMNGVLSCADRIAYFTQ